jgi:DNA-binding transcriptional LysR family regulator
MKSHVKKFQNTANIKNLNCFELGESHINLVLREDHLLLKTGLLDDISNYPYVIVEEYENFGQLYDESSKPIFELFQKTPKTIISTNDSMGCQNIVAGTDAFFISSTPYRHTQHYRFASVPLGGEGNVLTYFYVLRKNQELSKTDAAYIQALKQMFTKPKSL